MKNHEVLRTGNKDEQSNCDSAERGTAQEVEPARVLTVPPSKWRVFGKKKNSS